MDKFTEWLKSNPEYIGLIFVVVGIVHLVATLRDANWLFGDVSTNTRSKYKIDGMVNRYGRKRARWIVGFNSVSVIAAGIVWFIICFFYIL